jgi:hypothetical protein
MHRIMVQPLVPGVRLTAIFDSCYSGATLDLPYIYSTQGILKEPNLAKEAGTGLLGIISSYSQGGVGVAKSCMDFFRKATSEYPEGYKKQATKTSPADVVIWSLSSDDMQMFVPNPSRCENVILTIQIHRQNSPITTQASGSISWAFIAAMQKNREQSYVQLLYSIQDELATKNALKPNLTCNHPLSKIA